MKNRNPIARVIKRLRPKIERDKRNNPVRIPAKSYADIGLLKITNTADTDFYLYED